MITMSVNLSISSHAPAPKKRYILEYYEPGVRPNSLRKARRDVDSVREAEEWLNANKEAAFLPATVLTRSWKRNVVAFFAPMLPARPLAD